jgi:hypothetical protein
MGLRDRLQNNRKWFYNVEREVGGGCASRALVARRLLLIISTLPGTAFAQVRARADSTSRSATAIRAVELHRTEVFDSVEARFWPYRVANALHVVTRPHVIRRELLFAPGDAYDTARVHESERNLRALGIFRDVEIDSVVTDSGLIARIRTNDAWTTVPGFDISSSGTQTVVNLSLQESNLFGTRTVAVIGYENTPDRSSVAAGFDAPRVIGNSIGVGASYVDLSDGHAGAASIRYPFFNLSSRRGASLSGHVVDARVLRFVEGEVRPADSLRRKFAILRADAAAALAASPRGFIHVGLTAQVRREDYGPEETPDALDRTVTGALGPFLETRAPRYLRVKNVTFIDRIEDIDLGFRMRAGVLLAPRAWGYERDGVGGSLSGGIGHRIPRGFFFVEGSASGIQNGGAIDSGTVDASGTLVMQPHERWLLIGFLGGGLLQNPHPGGEFDLGLGYALRAFPAHSFTGDRRYLMNAESRLLLWPRLLGLVGVGVAAFVDHAGAWFIDSRTRSGTDAGVGLRLASIREAGSVWRLDFAYRYPGSASPPGWVVSVGRGFVFLR